jgi:hypothetical protein
LTWFARQQNQIVIYLRLGRSLRFGGARVSIRNGDREPRAPDNDCAAGIGDGDPSIVVDHAGPVSSMRYSGSSSTNANRRDGRIYCGFALMARLSTYKSKRSLDERTRHLSSSGIWIVDKMINHKRTAGTDVNRGLVN